MCLYLKSWYITADNKKAKPRKKKRDINPVLIDRALMINETSARRKMVVISIAVSFILFLGLLTAKFV